MRRVFGLGETVLDIIFKEGIPIGAKAGGSALNALVSLARVGMDTYFISEIGADKVGDLMTDFLHKNRVSTKHIHRNKGSKSPLALAFLNDHNDAEYEFYKDYANQKLSWVMPDFQKDDILLFGSFFGINPAIRPQVVEILNHARKSEVIIIFDPNFRGHHKDNLESYLPILLENFEFSDIVKGSNEDFLNIFETSNSEDTYQLISKYCKNLVYTANQNGVNAHNDNVSSHFTVPQINPVSTIGAGDNFNSGIIKAICDLNLDKESVSNLNIEDWKYLMATAIEFSTEVCCQLDNYVSEVFVKGLNDRIKDRLSTFNE